MKIEGKKSKEEDKLYIIRQYDEEEEAGLG